jgi:predicted ATPase
LVGVVFMKKFSLPAAPLLDEVRVEFSEDVNFKSFPFSLPIIKNLKNIQFPTQVTFFVGENGAGKSTILEAIACKAGFGAEGGSKNIQFKTAEEITYTSAQQLSDQLVLSWRKKPKDGYFFRAESFYNVANYLDTLTRESAYAYGPYGGKSLHNQSHGESFFRFLPIV